MLTNLKDGLLQEIKSHEESLFSDPSKPENVRTIESRVETWKYILREHKIEEDMNAHRYFDPTIFHDCENHLTTLILRLYSMDSFLQSQLNKATLTQDVSKVQTLGPFAVALRSLLFGASDHRVDISLRPNYSIFRGLLLTMDQLV